MAQVWPAGDVAGSPWGQRLRTSSGGCPPTPSTQESPVFLHLWVGRAPSIRPVEQELLALGGAKALSMGAWGLGSGDRRGLISAMASGWGGCW